MKVKEGYLDFLRTEPNHFDVSKSDTAVWGVEDANSVKLMFWTAHRTNWQNSEHVERRTHVTLAVKV
jgi:hypothetical protein